MLATNTAGDVPPSPRQDKAEEDSCSEKEEQCQLNNNVRPTPLTPLEPKFNRFDYVELPNTVVNRNRSFVVVEDDEGPRFIPRWELIKEQVHELKRVVSEGGNVGEAIKHCVLGYNCGCVCTFGVLYDMIELATDLFGDGELREVVQFIGDACLGVEGISGGVRKLKGVEGGGGMSVELGRREVLSLLACGFLCTFPGRDGKDVRGPYARYPRINFDGLFDDKEQSRLGSWRSGMKEAKVHRLLCIFNYFRRMRERNKAGKIDCSKVVYERRTLSPEDTPRWGVHLNHEFCVLEVMENGSIDDSRNSLHIDFANKFVGGGTLGNGAAMEEIMFSQSPELIASQVFTKVLSDNECLVVHGAEKFSDGEGYGAGFRWLGDHLDDRVEGPRVGVMDAVKFERSSLGTQLRKKWIGRELTKVYVTVKGADVVASGKWGAGVFNGDPLLKCLLQWISASVAGVRVLELYTFGDKVLCGQLQKIMGIVRGNRCTVGEMIWVLLQFGENSSQPGTKDLYEYVCGELGGNDSEGVDEEEPRKLSLVERLKYIGALIWKSAGLIGKFGGLAVIGIVVAWIIRKMKD